jgi:hypothetical protein
MKTGTDTMIQDMMDNIKQTKSFVKQSLNGTLHGLNSKLVKLMESESM